MDLARVNGPPVEELTKKDVVRAVRAAGVLEGARFEFYADEATKRVDVKAFVPFQPAIVAASLPNVMEIDAYAFHKCVHLERVDMPRVAFIGYSAFLNCISLRQISPVLHSLIIMGDVFVNCKALDIDVGEMFPKMLQVGHRAFYDSGVRAKTLRIKFPEPSATDTYQFDAPCEVGVAAFRYCRNIENVVLDTARVRHSAFIEINDIESVSIIETELGADAFAQCTNLKTLSINGAHLLSVIEGEEDAPVGGSFRGCTQLKTLHLNGGLWLKPQVNNNPFEDCPISRVVLHGREHELAPRDLAIHLPMRVDGAVPFPVRTAVFHCSMIDALGALNTWVPDIDVGNAPEFEAERGWNHSMVLQNDSQKLIVMPLDTTLKTAEEREAWSRRPTHIWDRDYLVEGRPEVSQEKQTDWTKPSYFAHYMKCYPFVLTNDEALERHPSKSFFRPVGLAKFISSLMGSDDIPAVDQDDGDDRFPVVFRRMANLIADAFASCPEGRVHMLLNQTVQLVEYRARRPLMYFVGKRAPRAAADLRLALVTPAIGRPGPKTREEDAMAFEPEMVPELVQDILRFHLGPPAYTPEDREVVRRAFESKREATESKMAGGTNPKSNPGSQRSTGIATPLFAIRASDGPRNRA